MPIPVQKNKVQSNYRFFRFGNPPRYPHSFFYRLDLNRFNIIAKDPLVVRNTISIHTRWTKEDVDYWPQNAYECEDILRTGKEDCDGLTTLAVSWLYTKGVDVRFALGRYKEEKGGPNHTYALIYENINSDPLLIEVTGSKVIEELPRLSTKEEYHTLISCGPTFDSYWVHGDYERLFA